jgi:uncharacterized integral membrane protein (TIGR00698 family)
MKRTFNNSSSGIIIASLTGLAGYVIRLLTGSPIADPLVIALVFGIILRTVLGDREDLKPGFSAAPAIFLPIGIIFYGANNLNFMRLSMVEPRIIMLVVVIMAVYFGVILLLGKKMNQKDQITYLTAAGSAICGASAIAVTSPAVDADADDISVSLLSVTIVSFTGVSMLLPFLSAVLNLSHETFSELAGSTLQFTGLVRIAPLISFPASQETMPGMIKLAISIKAVRYLALIIAIPLFASLIRKRFSIPWYLWAFLLAGFAGTMLFRFDAEIFSTTFVPIVNPVHNISWAIAMAAIGLNADIKKLLSSSGARAMTMSFAGYFAAVLVFLAEYYLRGVL